MLVKEAFRLGVCNRMSWHRSWSREEEGFGEICVSYHFLLKIIVANLYNFIKQRSECIVIADQEQVCGRL